MGFVDVSIGVTNRRSQILIMHSNALNDGNGLRSNHEINLLDGVQNEVGKTGITHTRLEVSSFIAACTVVVEQIETIELAQICDISLAIWTFDRIFFNSVFENDERSIIDMGVCYINDVNARMDIREIFLSNLS